MTVSPQCPQEIGLLTLPHTVFQGAEISSEHTSQFLPPGNVAELRGSPPLRGSLERLVRLSPAGVPSQDIELAALITPEASLERLGPLVGSPGGVGAPAKRVSFGSCLSRLWFCRSSLPWRWRGSEDRRGNRRLRLKQSWCPWPRTYEGRPLWGRAAYTAVHCARLSSVPSGDRSVNPATYGVPGHSDLQRAHISVSSARKRSEAERLATPSGVSRATRSAFSFRCAVPGYRTSCSDYTRGLSRETGSLSRLFGSVVTTAKCVSLGPAHCRSSSALRRCFSTRFLPYYGLRAGSGNRTGEFLRFALGAKRTIIGFPLKRSPQAL